MTSQSHPAPTALRVLDRDEVQRLIDPDESREAVRRAFIAHAAGRAQLPGVIHLDLGTERGDLHVKCGWITDDPTFTVKTAGAFAGAERAGLPRLQGLSLIFDAVTGQPRVLVNDGGWLTDLRTASAGAVAADHFLGTDPVTLAIVGTGTQARMQFEAIRRVRDIAALRIWGRRHAVAEALAADLGSLAPDADVSTPAALADALAGADAVVTVTAAREALVMESCVSPAALVIAVGSDTPGKQELDPALLTSAELVVVDDLAQSTEQGELQHVDPERLAHLRTMGDVLGEPHHAGGGRVVVDLTGLGVQDCAVGELVARTLRG
jgi:ornithine cyclodeaminase